MIHVFGFGNGALQGLEFEVFLALRIKAYYKA